MAGILYKKFEPYFIEKVLQLCDHEDRIRRLQDEIKGYEEDDRIMCDFVVSLLNHLMECGITFPHMTSTLDVSLEFIRNTCNSSLVNALRTLQQTLPTLNSINQYQTKCVLEFLNKTYFQHFHLYKYLLTQPRQQDYTLLNKVVYIPDVVDPLSGGTEESQWKYDEKVKSITERHKAALAEAEKTCRSRPLERLNKRGCVHKEALGDLVAGYIRDQCENIESEVRRSLKITEIAMEKELAIIEAGITKNKEKEINPDNAASPLKKVQSPKSPIKSAARSPSRKKSPSKK
ncbi:hypothetical protein ACHWQZ_G016113 [Mnemiopsis leidyi]